MSGCRDIMEPATLIVLCPAQTCHSTVFITKHPRGLFSCISTLTLLVLKKTTAAVNWRQTTANYGCDSDSSSSFSLNKSLMFLVSCWTRASSTAAGNLLFCVCAWLARQELVAGCNRSVGRRSEVAELREDWRLRFNELLWTCYRQ